MGCGDQWLAHTGSAVDNGSRLCGEALFNFACAEASYACKTLELRSPRASLALFPVIDRLPRNANQLAVARRGQAKL